MRGLRTRLAAVLAALSLLVATGAWTALPAQAGLSFNGID